MERLLNENFYHRHTKGEKYVNDFYLEKEYGLDEEKRRKLRDFYLE